MSSHELKNFIVPFFGFNEQVESSTFIGSAFIVNPNFLVTTGHNILNAANRSFEHYAIKFKDGFISLGEPVFSEYEYQLLVLGNCKDLALFYLEFHFEDAFNLEYVDLIRGRKHEIYGFIGQNEEPYYNSVHLMVSVQNSYSSYKNLAKEGEKAKLAEYVNCFSINEKITSGHSGCPIFDADKFLGMIIYGPDEAEIANNRNLNFGATALKFDYISHIIKSL